MKKRTFSMLLITLMFIVTMPTIPVVATYYTEIIPPKYDAVGFFEDGLVGVKLDDKYGFIDDKDNVVVPMIYEYTDEFSEGLAAVKKDGKWGYIDKTGTEIIPFKYDKAFDFKEGMAVICLNGAYGDAYGAINKTGEEIVAPSYAFLSSYSEGLAVCRIWNQDRLMWGYVDKTGAMVIEPKPYYYVSGFSDGLAWVIPEVSGKTIHYIDKAGKIVLTFEAEVDETRPKLVWDTRSAFVIGGSFNEGIAGIFLQPDHYIIDKSGSIIASLDYLPRGRFSEGLMVVNDWHNLAGSGPGGFGYYGFIDITGSVAIPIKFDQARDFCEGLAVVSVDGKCDPLGKGYYDGKWGYIDKTGKIVVDTVYDDAKDFHNGIAAVKKDGKWGFVRNLYTRINVTLNGDYINFDQPPIEENGHTLVPMRAIFEELGAAVEWDEDTKTVTATKNGIAMSLQIGSYELIRNGEKITFDVPSQLVGGRTLVPARAIAESFGANVDWNEDTRTVIITN